MVVKISALRALAPVFLGKMGQIIRRICFPGQNIAAVALVTQYLQNAAGGPLGIPKVGSAPQSGERIRNLLGGVPVQVHIKRQLNSGGLVWVDHKVAVPIVTVAQQLGRERDAVVQPHTQGAFHAAAPDPRFLFRHGGLKRKRHFGVIIQRKYALRLKKHAHWRLQLSQIAGDPDTQYHVARESGYAFGDDQVDHSGFTVADHLLERIPVSHGCSGNALIRIDPYQRPIWMAHHKVLVIFLLQLI